VKKRKNQP